MNNNTNLKPIEFTPFYPFLVICLSILSTFQFYFYGKSDHLEHLPIVFRIFDPQYLTNDFYTNTTAGAGPRFFGSHILAFLAGNASRIEWNFFLISLGLNISIGLITYYVTQSILKQSKPTAVMSSLFVLFLPSFVFGYYDRSIIACAIPAFLLIPVTYLCVFLYIKGKYAWIAPIAVIASFVHPTLGLGSGIILVNLGIFHEVYSRKAEIKKRWKPLLLKFIGLNALMGTAYLPYRITDAPVLLSNELFYLYTRYRAPLHFVASKFSASDYLQTISFLLAGIFSTRILKENIQDEQKYQRIILLFAGIMLACVAGWFFLEIVPGNMAATLFPYRYLMMLKWFGLILISSLLFGYLWNKIKGWYFASKSNTEIFINKSDLRNLILAALLLVVWGYLILPQTGFWLSVAVILFFIVLVLINSLGGIKKIIPVLILSITLVVVIVLGMVNSLNGPYEWIPDWLGEKFTPAITIDQNYDATSLALADFIKETTNENAVFLTPPGFGYIRILAQRALVCDLKAFPYQSNAQLEWQQRIFSCYGKTPDINYAIDMENEYKKMGDEKLLALKAIYPFDYAILYKTTSTIYPVIYTLGEYKIVDLTRAK